MSYSYTRSSTFTITHARQIASKIAADMYLCAAYYGRPSEGEIRNYAEEFAQLLNGGYVAEYEFGYKRDGQRVVCWRYRVQPDGTVVSDDQPGKVISYVDVTGASFYNSLTFSSTWYALDEKEREGIESGLPFSRTVQALPNDGNGYWVTDRNYSAGGLGVGRQTFRPF